MNKLQKILSLLLAVLLLQAPVLSLAEEAETPDAEPEATEAPADVEFPEELIARSYFWPPYVIPGRPDWLKYHVR